MPDVTKQATVEVYVTRPDGEQAVAQLMVGPDLLDQAEPELDALLGEYLRPLLRWGVGDETLKLTVGGLVSVGQPGAPAEGG